MKRFFSLILGEGFRVFFLGAVFLALLSLSLWLAAYFGGLDITPERISPSDWHAHELVFGYGGATLAGFFLTAVPNWTGAKAARHFYIGAAGLIWLLARVAILYMDNLPFTGVAVVELLFVPFIGAKIATQLVRKPKPQNVVFLIFLTFFWIGDCLVLLDWGGGHITGRAGIGLRVGLLSLAAMILVLGGRVTPAFTRNAMHRAGIEVAELADPAVFTPIALVFAIALPVVQLLFPNTLLSGIITLVAGLFALIRAAKWQNRFQWSQPILWTLHLSYGTVGVGLVLWGLAMVGFGSEVAGLHFLAVGGVGGMTVSVMSRASLGHSGRPLVAPSAMVVAYVLLPVAALVRWLGGVNAWSLYTPLVLLSGLIWCFAFALVLGVFWPILTQPRAPRSPDTSPPT